MERCCGIAAEAVGEVVGVGEMVRRWCWLSASDPQGGAVFPLVIHSCGVSFRGQLFGEKLTMRSGPYLIEVMTRHIAAEIIIC